MSTPEFDQHDIDIILQSQDEYAKEQSENVRSSDSTPENEKHRQEIDKPNESRKTSEKTASSSTSQGRHTNGPKKKTVESETVRRRMKKGKLGLIGGALLGASTAVDFSKRIKDGDTPIGAAAGAAGTAALGYLVGPGLMVGGAIAKEAAEGAFHMGEELMNKTTEVNRLSTMSPFASNRFIETRDTFTMRQAAMAAIGQSRGNLENAMIGSEAGMLHR